MGAPTAQRHGHASQHLTIGLESVLGIPVTIDLDLAGLPATARDGRLRAAISTLIATAQRHGARAIVIEDLDFAEARAEDASGTASDPRAAAVDAGSARRSQASLPGSSAIAWSK